jgi:hypothetical protein
MHPCKEGDHWVIGRNFRTMGGGGITGRRGSDSERARIIYDCWTGDRWCGQLSLAKTFQSEEAAQEYIDDNREQLEPSV